MMPHRDWEPPPWTPEDIDWYRQQMAMTEPLAAPGPPPVPKPPAPPRGSRRDWWFKGPGLIIVIVAGGLALAGAGGVFSEGSAAVDPGAKAVAKVISCQLPSTESHTAVVGIEVVSRSSTTETFRIDVEYRDDQGRRVDTDTAYARNVPPGDRVLLDEWTVLDAAMPSGTCGVSVR
jgi:hypothetical protein